MQSLQPFVPSHMQKPQPVPAKSADVRFCSSARFKDTQPDSYIKFGNTHAETMATLYARVVKSEPQQLIPVAVLGLIKTAEDGDPQKQGSFLASLIDLSTRALHPQREVPGVDPQSMLQFDLSEEVLSDLRDRLETHPEGPQLLSELTRFWGPVGDFANNWGQYQTLTRLARAIRANDTERAREIAKTEVRQYWL
jgi:hypothetical protein